jgi:hypothetical protein
MAFRSSAAFLAGVISAASAICALTHSGHAGSRLDQVAIDIEPPTWTSTEDEERAAAIQWIDLETIAAANARVQTAGTLGFDQPVLTMPDGSTATLNVRAHSGAVRAGITLNLK